MRQKPKPKETQEPQEEELWVNPRAQFRGPEGDRAWDNAGNLTPQSGAKFLEPADIALGIKKPVTKKKAAAAAADAETHQTSKTEPYKTS